MTANQATLILTEQISDWILALYQNVYIDPSDVSAPCHPPEKFKAWCFNHCRSLLDFDSGLWVSRSDMDDMVKSHWRDDTFLFNQPRSFVDNYAAIDAKPENTDVLNKALASNPGRFLSLWQCCDKTEFMQTEYYLQHCRKYNLANAISALMLPGQYSTIAHILSFYRSDPDHDFTEKEKTMADFMLPHLLEAYRANLLSSFKVQSKASYRGVIDRFGKVVVAQQGFVHAMTEKGWCQDGKVNIKVINDLTATAQLAMADTTVKLNFKDGLIYIDITESSNIERLSARQFDVCHYVVRGFTDQDIAGFLDISVSTVHKHVRKIFEILHVKNRAELTAYLIRQGKY